MLLKTNSPVQPQREVAAIQAALHAQRRRSFPDRCPTGIHARRCNSGCTELQIVPQALLCANACCALEGPLELQGNAVLDVLFWGRVGVHEVDDRTGIVHRLGVSFDARQHGLLFTPEHEVQNVAFDNNPGAGIRFNLYGEAIKAVLDGADFIECFRLFLEAGQDERESYKSAQRIFRGGDVRGRIAFTKDSAYLKGLMETHVLMNVAIRDNQPQVIERLFAGRLSLSDTITLGPCFESGFLSRPRYVPPWARDTRRLAASLAYSSFIMNVNLAPVTLDRFVAAAERSEESSSHRL